MGSGSVGPAERIRPGYPVAGPPPERSAELALTPGEEGRRTGALVIEEPMISIDTRFDLALAEYLATHSEKEDA